LQGIGATKGAAAAIVAAGGKVEEKAYGEAGLCQQATQKDWASFGLVFAFCLAIIIYRIGTHIPVPGFDPDRLADTVYSESRHLLGLFNMFSGGALERMSILALGVMPYISASIIMQLLSATVPALEQLKKEGDSGRRKINQYTRYGTVILGPYSGYSDGRWLRVTGAGLRS